jgi:ABC-type lipoprotein release transport system permease subunit
MYTQLAWRNIWRNPRRTLIILTAIFIGVASMIFLSSFMRGMMEGMVDNAIDNLTGHIRIQHPDFRNDPAVENRIPDPGSLIKKIKPLLPRGARVVERIRVDAVVNTSRENAGVIMVGIEPEKEINCSFIGDAPLDGKLFTDDDKNGIVIGRALLEKLGTRINSKVVLMSQGADGEIASRAFRIRGIYRSQMADTEKTFVFVPLRAARKMLKLGDDATEIGITLPGDRMADMDLSPLTESLNEQLAGRGVIAEDWRQVLPAMSAYLEMFDVFLYIWYLVVFVAMGFGIVNTVLMAVYERMREFGLLKALGMRPVRIFLMVVRETLFLLAVGMGMGNLTALVGIHLLSHTGIDLSAFSEGVEMWGISRVILPVVTAGDLLTANLTVLILGLVVGIYPAVKAARFTPVETMRHV